MYEILCTGRSKIVIKITLTFTYSVIDHLKMVTF